MSVIACAQKPILISILKKSNHPNEIWGSKHKQYGKGGDIAVVGCNEHYAEFAYKHHLIVQGGEMERGKRGKGVRGGRVAGGTYSPPPPSGSNR